MNPFSVIVVAALLARYGLDTISDWLNLRHLSETLPPEFEGCYDAERYRRSQQYLRDGTRLGLLEDTCGTVVVLAFILSGGFNAVDGLARRFGLGPIPTGLVFAGILALGARLLSLPFAVHNTFVIEARYGFNKTTPRTFVLDLIKSLILTAVIGGPVLAGVLWFFERAGARAWLLCWALVSAVQVFLVYLAPRVIMPLFNKFTPLEDGPLRAAIEAYARAQRFRLRGIFKMDGSRRSGKTNAFFTGFGRSRRIVLYDTLMAKHTVPELLAVVAHEMGHCRMGHVPQALLRSAAMTALTFFLLTFFLGNAELFRAFRMEHVSTYASLVFFGFLYTPLGMAMGMAENALSRRHEFAADGYAVLTTGAREPFVAALKKLAVDNLSNLSPHPLKVFLSYSHPPVLARIRRLAAGLNQSGCRLSAGGSNQSARPTSSRSQRNSSFRRISSAVSPMSSCGNTIHRSVRRR